jgi:hypothetical protein
VGHAFIKAELAERDAVFGASTLGALLLPRLLVADTGMLARLCTCWRLWG